MNNIIKFAAKHFMASQTITSLLFFIILYFSSTTSLYETLKGNRAAIYGAFAAIFGSLLGFVLTSMSVILTTLDQPRMRAFRNTSHYHTLWKVFTATIQALAVACLASLLALIFDRDTSPNHFLLCLSASTAFLACLFLWNCVRLLEAVVMTPMNPSDNNN